MIFLTVGTQLAFPRLTAAMDAHAARTGEKVIAQVGSESESRPHLDLRGQMDPASYDEVFIQARLVVAHAGIGTILSARKHRRPLVVVPRQFVFGEHRNDHQMATARAFERLRGLYVAWSIDQLPDFLSRENLEPCDMQRSEMHGALVQGLATFIASGRA